MDDHSEETRRIYQAQHERIANDPRAMKRFVGMFNEDYFGLPKGFFAGKSMLDAGCGNTAKLLTAFYRMGASDLYGCDLGTEFIEASRASLERQGISRDAIRFKSGSVVSLPYDDNSFDFVCCHGVLLHLNSFDEVRTAFNELVRVTKPGGLLYTVYANTGGLWEDCIIPAGRAYYRSNPEFRDLIDKIAPEHFSHLISIVERGILEHEGVKVDLSWLRDALDTDLCVTIQNCLQCPTYLRIDEEMIRDLYGAHSFSDLRRLRRYVKRENVRRFFAPLHYERGDGLVDIIYGSGSLEFIARKNQRAE